jgi:hypothetical protein
MRRGQCRGCAEREARVRSVVLVGSLSCLVDGVYWVLLALTFHLPPSAVPLVSDYRFRSSAQRLARLT